MARTKKKLRESDANKIGHTEHLAIWISRVRSKKLICRRNRRRNLRIEAMLTCALFKAEHDLRVKQLSRVLKWKQVKKELLKKANLNYEDCDDEVNEYPGLSQENNPWKEPLCPELSSLDNFMSELAKVKVPLQR